MKMLKRVLPVAVFGLLAGTAMAAVDNSHHDLKAFSGGATTEVCLYCHGITSATTNTGYGAIGDLCVSRCHLGATGFPAVARTVPNRAATINEAGAAVAAVPTLDAVRAQTATVTGGHGLDKARLLGPYGAAGAEAFNTIGNALPYAGATTLQCTSCHNVHDNANAPFLQRDLFTGGPVVGTGTVTGSFCEACHTTRGNRWNDTEVAPNGEHPVNFAVVLGNSAARTLGGRGDRYINFDTTIYETTSINGAGLDVAADEYTTGGKVTGWTNVATGVSKMGCYTCHGAHIDNGAAGRYQPNLIVRDGVSADGVWNPLCVGCHGSDTAGVDDPNPGVTAYYHPAGTTANAATAGSGSGADIRYTYAASTGAFTFTVQMAPILNPGNQGAMADAMSGINDMTVPATAGKPRCTSCHDVHGGINNSMALLELDGSRNGTFVGKACDVCHDGTGLVDLADNSGEAGEGANSHHRTHVGDWGAGTVDDANTETLIMPATSGVSASWLTAADHANGLGCADCHVFDGTTHSTAHNW